MAIQNESTHTTLPQKPTSAPSPTKAPTGYPTPYPTFYPTPYPTPYDYGGLNYGSISGTSSTATTIFYICLVLGIIGGVLLCVCCYRKRKPATGAQHSATPEEGPVELGAVYQRF